jgi:Cu/Ag efflux protein CusF
MRHAFALLALGVALPFATPAQAGDATAVHRIDDLVPAFTERPRPQETLRGVVAGIDERNDRITLRLITNANADFKVQDALLFNAVHDGDQVEITVETIEGVRTIVGLRKE